MVEPAALLIAGIIFLAVFMQGVVGFGLALISMPLLVGLVGFQVAAPLVALVGLVSQIVMITYYRQAVKLSAITPLAIGSVIGIPLGVLALKSVDEAIFSSVLGVLVIGYAVYELVTPRLPELSHAGWGYAFGLAGGVLTGAFNTGGPPLVVYGTCRRWLHDEFKGNVQALFLVHSVTVLVAHAAAGSFSDIVLRNFVVAVPAAALGLAGGIFLDRYLNQTVFRKIVLGTLILLGINLLL